MAAVSNELLKRLEERANIPEDDSPWGGDEPPGPQDDDVPAIQMGTDVHRVVAELDAALGARDPLVYQRDNEIVAIAGSKAKAGKALLVAGTPIIRQLDASSLLPRVTEHVRFLALMPPSAKASRLAEQGGRPPPQPTQKRIIPPASVLNAFLGALDWPHVRPLTGITECPALRPDGTVLQDAGYDAATGYLYLPSCDYLRVADEPTHSDAVLSYTKLAEVFCDFPYVSDEHRSAVVASILSLVARPAIEGSVPAFFFDASSRRSGKTLQVDVVSLIVSGRAASRMTFPETDEELEKVLAGYALVGARMINFDNLSGPVGGAALDKCITAVDTVDLRVLGTAAMRSLVWRAVVFASGNNIRGRHGSDILERVLAPRVESPLDHPEKRDPSTLRHPDLRAWTRANRGVLVHAALTILRAYCAAGRPRAASVEPWGGFEPWTALIAQALVWTGAPNPLGARRGGDDDQDPVRRAQHVLVSRWGALCTTQGADGLTVSAVTRAIFPPPRRDEPPDGHDDLREAIAELTRCPSGATPDSRRVGAVLQDIKRKPFDGMMLQPVGTSGGVARWGVVRAR